MPQASECHICECCLGSKERTACATALMRSARAVDCWMAASKRWTMAGLAYCSGSPKNRTMLFSESMQAKISPASIILCQQSNVTATHHNSR